MQHDWYCITYIVWFKDYDQRVFDFRADLSTEAIMCLDFVEGEFSYDEKSSSVWNHK